jgi:hypothetical protein
MSKKWRRWKVAASAGFGIGALVPLFWGVLALVTFNAPEGRFSNLFWRAVYLTCPFWVIGGQKALVLMPLLNGLLYSALVVSSSRCFRPDDLTRADF